MDAYKYTLVGLKLVAKSTPQVKFFWGKESRESLQKRFNKIYVLSIQLIEEDSVWKSHVWSITSEKEEANISKLTPKKKKKIDDLTPTDQKGQFVGHPNTWN